MTGSRYRILGLVAAIVVVILALKNYEIWNGSNRPRALREETKKAVPKPRNLPPFLPAGERVPRTSLPAIAAKNIFSPDRKEFPWLTGTEKEKPLPRPQVFLYGVAITDQFQSASVVSPGRVLRKGERAMKTMKPGDQIEGYKLARIEADRITLESPGDSFVVLLFDPKSPKTRVPFRTDNKVPGVTGPVPQPSSTPVRTTGESAGKAPLAVPVKPAYLPDSQESIPAPSSGVPRPEPVPDPEAQGGPRS